MLDQIFVYGTLEFPVVVKRVLGIELRGRAGQLFGFGCFKLKSFPYPAVVAMGKEKVQGTVLCITPKQVKLLDRYEGSMYARKQVKVVLSDKHILSAWVYVLADRFKKELSNEPWDRQKFADNHLARYLKRMC